MDLSIRVVTTLSRTHPAWRSLRGYEDSGSRRINGVYANEEPVESFTESHSTPLQGQMTFTPRFYRTWRRAQHRYYALSTTTVYHRTGFPTYMETSRHDYHKEKRGQRPNTISNIKSICLLNVHIGKTSRETFVQSTAVAPRTTTRSASKHTANRALDGQHAQATQYTSWGYS